MLPPGGLEKLNPPFQIRKLAGRTDVLPISHTCFNLLELPQYSSAQVLKDKVLLAIRNVAAADFGFA